LIELNLCANLKIHKKGENRMNFIKASLALGLMTSLVACSNSSDSGSGGGSVAKFADPAASKSVTTSFAALQNIQAKKSHKNGVRAFLKSSEIEQKDVQVLTEKLEQKLNTKDCVMKIPSEEAPQEPNTPPQNGMGVDVQDSLFEISGDNCPLTASIFIDSYGDQQNIKLKFAMNLVVKTPELQKEMNLTEASFSGDLNGTGNQLSPNSFTMKMTGVFAGKGTTLSHGPFSSSTSLTFDMAASMSEQAPGNGDTNVMGSFTVESTEKSSFVFGAERTELASHVKMDAQGRSAEFFINGKSVSAEEYAAYASQINFPGVGNGGDNVDNQQPPAANSACEVLAFDAVQMPETTIQQIMSSPQGIGTLIPMAGAYASGCGMMSGNTGRVNGKIVTLQMMFLAETNKALIDVNGTKTELYLQPEFQDFATTTVAGVSVVYACKPVRACGQ